VVTDSETQQRLLMHAVSKTDPVAAQVGVMYAWFVSSLQVALNGVCSMYSTRRC